MWNIGTNKNMEASQFFSQTRNYGCQHTTHYNLQYPTLLINLWSIPDFKIDKFLFVNSLFRKDNVCFYISDDGMFVFNQGKTQVFG